MTDDPSQPMVDVGIALIRRGDTVLICRRPPHVPLGGYWEFPGGKREANETIEQCVVRECREELGIRVVPIRRLDVIEHTYEHGRVRLFPFICDLASGEPAAQQAEEMRWVSPSELADYPFPPANKPILRLLHGGLG